MAATIERFDSNGRLSRIVKHGNVIYLSGIIGTDGGADIRGQTANALKQVDEHLAKCGVDKTHVLSVQVWLRDVSRDLEGMNEVWCSWVVPGHEPARASGESRLFNPAALIEVLVVAAA